MYQKSILGNILVIAFFLQWMLQLQPMQIKKINFRINCFLRNNLAKFNKLTLVLFNVCFIGDFFSCMVLPMA